MLVIEQESRAIAGRTARCRCKIWYVSNFTTTSRGFSATARLSGIDLRSTSATFQMLKLHTVRWFSRPWHKITAIAENYGTRPESR